MTIRAIATHYANLRAAEWPCRDEAAAFERHVLACVLAAGLSERDSSGQALSVALGLKSRDILDIVVRHFPLMPLAGFDLGELPDPHFEMEEELLRDLLLSHRSTAKALPVWLASIIARRSMQADHLWQDLGLFDRGDLNRLLQTWFPTLHAGNTTNMRWKKYFYRQLCEAEGFALCTAPSCSVCADFDNCFGAEDGMSRLAEIRRDASLAA